MTTKLLLISVPHNISDRKCFTEMSPHIIHEEYIQTWSSNVFHDDKCIAYIIFKEVFEFESYLTLLPERLRIIFTQFRLVTQNCLLRWFNIDRNERYCTLCNRNEIGDEFYLLFQCITLIDQRNKFLTRYFINHSNSFKFSVLFNIHSLNKLTRICKLIKIIIATFN